MDEERRFWNDVSGLRFLIEQGAEAEPLISAMLGILRDCEYTVIPSGKEKWYLRGEAE